MSEELEYDEDYNSCKCGNKLKTDEEIRDNVCNECK